MEKELAELLDRYELTTGKTIADEQLKGLSAAKFNGFLRDKGYGDRIDYLVNKGHIELKRQRLADYMTMIPPYEEGRWNNEKYRQNLLLFAQFIIDQEQVDEVTSFIKKHGG